MQPQPRAATGSTRCVFSSITMLDYDFVILLFIIGLQLPWKCFQVVSVAVVKVCRVAYFLDVVRM